MISVLQSSKNTQTHLSPTKRTQLFKAKMHMCNSDLIEAFAPLLLIRFLSSHFAKSKVARFVYLGVRIFFGLIKVKQLEGKKKKGRQIIGLKSILGALHFAKGACFSSSTV